MADTVGVNIFVADIIYHLFDRFTKFREEWLLQKREEFKHLAIFPCKLRIYPEHVFNSRDPIVVGVCVEAGFLREGTMICVPSKEVCQLKLVSGVFRIVHEHTLSFNLTDVLHAFSARHCRRRRYVSRSSHLSICLSSQVLLPRYLMNSLNSFEKTDRKYSLAPTDDLITFWRSKVKIKAGLSMWWRGHPRWRCVSRSMF